MAQTPFWTAPSATEPIPPHDFVQEFSRYTERGAALTAIAELEVFMANCLRQMMIKDKSEIEAVFGEYGTLGNIRGKNVMCYLLGVTTKETFEELKIISRIRNTFAHEARATGFAFSKVAKDLGKLGISKDDRFVHKYYKYIYSNQPGNTPDVLADTFIKMSRESRRDSALPHWGFIAEMSILAMCFGVARFQIEKGVKQPF